MAYATTQQLADYLGVELVDLPADASRLLDRASEDIDFQTLNRASDKFADGGAVYVAAIQKATCAQVEYWITDGESVSIGPALKSYRMSKYAAEYADAGGPPRLAPRARQFLLLTGLLYRGVSLA